MVGVIDDSMRLPGSILFAAPWTRPNVFGAPGLVAKSSISLLSKKPAPVTVTALPHDVLSVVVSATAMPPPSTTDRFVVWLPSSSGGTADDGVALSLIDATSLSAYAEDSSRSTGGLTNAGSPSSSLRVANARRQISTSQCTCAAECQPSFASSVARSMFAVIANTIPPDDGSGIVTSV